MGVELWSISWKESVVMFTTGLLVWKWLARSLKGQALSIHMDKKTSGIWETRPSDPVCVQPQGDFVDRFFLTSLWVSMIYEHVYWCLSHGPSHWLLSSTISSQMNHQWTNWGMSLLIWDIYWGYASLWTSPLVSQSNKGKTDGLHL